MVRLRDPNAANKISDDVFGRAKQRFYGSAGGVRFRSDERFEAVLLCFG